MYKMRKVQSIFYERYILNVHEKTNHIYGWNAHTTASVDFEEIFGTSK